MKIFFLFFSLLFSLESFGLSLDDFLPPYNRSGGRDGCISTKFSAPGAWTIYSLDKCAEDSAANTYRTPKIRVRAQSCNFAACWTQSTDLNGNGECVIWPGPYVMPLTRICARVAVPADPVSGSPQDDGYTPRKHLDSDGRSQNDIPIQGSDGVPFYIDSSKICAYHDPWMLEYIALGTWTIPFFDPMDYNPIKQPMHSGSGISPIAQLIINLVEFGMELTADTMVSGGYGPLAGKAMRLAAQKQGGWINDLMEFIPKVIDIIGKNTIIALLKEFGQFNRQVFARLGCANLKLGYFPPPYCSSKASLPPSGNVTMICPDNGDGINVNPWEVECVQSTTPNNAINNAVRVSFDKMIPICKASEMAAGKPLSDKCVTFNMALNGASSVNSAASHVNDTLPKGTLPQCTAAINTNCVNITLSTAPNNLRIVYGMNYGSAAVPKPYYNASEKSPGILQYPDCTASITSSCQTIWGVNAGGFIDMSLAFKGTETTYSNDPPLTSLATSNAADPDAAIHKFQAQITRKSGLTQLQSNICVYSKNTTASSTPDEIVGCVPRASPPKPLLSLCGGAQSTLCTILNDATSNQNPTSNVSTNTSPLMIVKLQAGTSSTQGVLGVSSVHDVSGINTALNLAGFDYSAYVTNESFATIPFSSNTDPNANPDAGTLYGQYIAPDGTPAQFNTPNAAYLSGMEYTKGKYKLGGQYICLKGSDTGTCPSNVKNCVLAKLLNANITPCSSFIQKMQNTYSGIKRCSAVTPSTSCTTVETINPPAVSASAATSTSGASAVTYSTEPVIIKDCTPTSSSTTTSQKTYCYYHSLDLELCKISTDSANRITPTPDYGSDLSSLAGELGYYNYKTPPPSSSQVTTNASAATMECGVYLSSLSNTDYGNIAPCSASDKLCPRIEYFTSPTSSGDPTILHVNKCTNATTPAQGDPTTTNRYCYYTGAKINASSSSSSTSPDPSASSTLPSNTICQLDQNSTIRRTDDGTTITSRARCSKYLTSFNSKIYPGISECLPYQKNCELIEYLVPTEDPTAKIFVNKYSTDSYCYYQDASRKPQDDTRCNLSITYPGLRQCSSGEEIYCRVVTSQDGLTIYDYSGNIEAIETNTGKYCYSTNRRAPINFNQKVCKLNQQYPNIGICSPLESFCPLLETRDATGAATVSTNIRTINNNTYCYKQTPSPVDAPTCSVASAYPNLQECSTSQQSCPSVSSVNTAETPSRNINVNQYSATGYCYYYGSKVPENQAICAAPNVQNTPAQNICSLPIGGGTVTRKDSNDQIINQTATTSSSGGMWNADLYALRNKTPMEQGLCTTIPSDLPKCSAITAGNSASGNATWPETPSGGKATGTCISGYASKTPPMRYCLTNTNTFISAFQTTAPSSSCIPKIGMSLKDSNGTLVYNFSPGDDFVEIQGSTNTGTYTVENKCQGSMNKVSVRDTINETDFGASLSVKINGVTGVDYPNIPDALRAIFNIQNKIPNPFTVSVEPQGRTWKMKLDFTCPPPALSITIDGEAQTVTYNDLTTKTLVVTGKQIRFDLLDGAEMMQLEFSTDSTTGDNHGAPGAMGDSTVQYSGGGMWLTYLPQEVSSIINSGKYYIIKTKDAQKWNIKYKVKKK
ncbi:MAG: hypothetical protein V4485_02330 [Pseudomonadota bacterium]